MVSAAVLVSAVSLVLGGRSGFSLRCSPLVAAQAAHECGVIGQARSIGVGAAVPVVRFKDGKTVVTHIAELPADAPGRLH